MKTLAFVYAVLFALASTPSHPWPYALLLLAALAAVGDLWLRALTAEPAAPVVRAGLATAAGLFTLPLAAITLHVLGVRSAPRPLALVLAVVATVLAAVALARSGSRRVAVLRLEAVDARMARTLGAMAVPAVLATGVGVAAVHTYERLPHPPAPGYTSIALAGWAAAVDRPVLVPAAGLLVPVELTAAGRPADERLTVTVGDRPAGPPRPVRLAAGGSSVVSVLVPEPRDGCLHRVRIALGATSTVFYAYAAPRVPAVPPAHGAPRVLVVPPAHAASRSVPVAARC
jgi:hypothetical protein